MPKLKHKIRKLRKFFNYDMWQKKLYGRGFWRDFPLRVLRVFYIAVEGFRRDECVRNAMALTFFSLLSIVPVLALAFGIAKGFGLENNMEVFLRQSLEGQEDIFQKSLNFTRSLLNNTKGGLIAGIGLVVLLYTVMRLLNHIEFSFNAIWKISSQRSLLRKFTDYLSLMLIAPVLAILSVSLTVFISSQIRHFGEASDFTEYITPFFLFVIKLTPYLILWLLLTLIYVVMPNQSVSIKKAFVSAVIAGTVFQLLQWGYINFQIGVSRYNAIYGSFAALPLFLIWLQLSWNVILFGGELSYALQNEQKYEFRLGLYRLSPKLRQELALLVTHYVIKKFEHGAPTNTAKKIADELQLPFHLTEEMLKFLQKSRILFEVKEEKQTHFVPAIDIEKLTVHYVLERINKQGRKNLPLPATQEFKKIQVIMKNFNREIERLPSNKPLKNM